MITDCVFDYRDLSEDALDALKSALEPHGLHVTVHPISEGTDSWVVLFSDHELTQQELDDLQEEFQPCEP